MDSIDKDGLMSGAGKGDPWQMVPVEFLRGVVKVQRERIEELERELKWALEALDRIGVSQERDASKGRE